MQPATDAAFAGLVVQMIVAFLVIVPPGLGLIYLVEYLITRRQAPSAVALDSYSQQTLETIRAKSPDDFERFCCELMSAKGYKALRTGGEADGGVDVVAWGEEGKVAVQCKKWRDRLVGVAIVRELCGSMTLTGAVHGWLITTSRFTAEARKSAGKLGNVTLIDREELVRQVAGHSCHEGLARALRRPAEGWGRRGWLITCHACGRRDTVPFRPYAHAKLLCRACYRATEHDAAVSERRSSGPLGS